jgi:hypothetical protein
MIGCAKSELSLFDPQQFQTVIDRGVYIKYQPITSVTSTGPIEFHVPGTTEEYIDVNETMLYVRATIKNEDDTNLIVDADVLFTNMPLASLFADVQLYLNGHQIEGGNQLYPFKAMISSLVQTNESTKRNQLLASGYVKETAGNLNNRALASSATRKAWTALSASREFCGPLHLDFLQQNKLLLSQVDINIKLVRTQPTFALLKAAAVNAKIIIEDAELIIRKVRVAPSVINGHESGLTKRNVIYPLNRCQVISHTIPAGSLQYTKDNLFRGQMPKLVIFGLVLNTAFSGSYTENPFNFQHFGLNQIALSREGESFPHAPFKPDFAHMLCMREYMAMYQAMELYNKDDEFGMTFNEWRQGSTLFAFNLAPDMCLSGHAQPMREGNLRLELGFANETAALINLVVWAIFDSKIEITRTRDILMDYKS